MPETNNQIESHSTAWAIASLPGFRIKPGCGGVRKLILALAICLWSVLVPRFAEAVEVGDPAPDFKLPALDGKNVGLADFKGQVVLLKLATTWCPTCAQLSGELADLSNFLKAKDVVLLDVYLQDTPEMVERHLQGKTMEMKYIALIDDRQVYKAYNIYLIPRFLVLDRNQKVVFDNGASAAIPSEEEIKQLVEVAAKHN